MICLNKGFRRASLIVFLSLAFYVFIASASSETVEDSVRNATEDVIRWKPGPWKPCSNCHQPGNISTGISKIMPHGFVFESHDKLGTNRTKACFFCHDVNQRDMLITENLTLVNIEDTPSLCYKCHPTKYDEWSFGAHGRTDWKCTDPRCHNPHNPRLTGVALGDGYPLPPPPRNSPKPPFIFAAEASNEPYYKSTMDFFFIAVAVIILVHIIAFIGWKALGMGGK